MPEVDAGTLELLQRSHKLLNTLNGDAASRTHLEQAIKKHFPDVVTEAEAGDRIVQPRLDAFQNDVVNPLVAELKAQREEREARTAAQTEAQLTEAFTDIRRNRGFTDEGIEEVKRLMVERSIADPHAAAALFAERNPPAAGDAPSWTPANWDIANQVTDTDITGLFADETKWADNMAARALNEIRVGQAA